jgi:hypothetical protein
MDGARFARTLWLSVNKRLSLEEQKAVELERAAYLREREHTIKSAAEYYENENCFLRMIGSRSEYGDDPVVIDFVQGVLAEYARREEDIKKFPWMYEGVPHGR